MNISNIQQRYNDDDELIVSASLDSIDFSNITHEDDGVKLQERTIRVGNNWAANNTNWKPVVNAVDIDWNGAKIGENKTLNTTGELLLN